MDFEYLHPDEWDKPVYNGMMDNHWDEIEPQDELAEPRWTPRRVIYLAIILLTLIMFLLYTLWPVFFPPAPPPPLLPRQQV